MLKTLLLTLFCLLAFAGNSVLCRLALMEPIIDAASFTTIRLISGSIVLTVLLLIHQSHRKENSENSKGSWLGAIALFVYAITFSYAYILLDTAVGALLLFGSVQITLIICSVLLEKKRLNVELWGMALSFGGFLLLVWPELTHPSMLGVILMSIAGIAWAIYTLVGKNTDNPIRDTAFNFLRTLPMVATLFLIMLPTVHITAQGVFLAVVSGGVTSGLGYALWYGIVKNFSSIQAGVVQLLVPIIAAIGGVVFAGEVLSIHLGISALLTLGGVAMVMLAQSRN